MKGMSCFRGVEYGKWDKWSDLGKWKREKGLMVLFVIMELRLHNEMESNENKLGFHFQNSKLMRNTSMRSNSTLGQ